MNTSSKDNLINEIEITNSSELPFKLTEALGQYSDLHAALGQSAGLSTLTVN